MRDVTYLTAISRRALSRPMRWLVGRGLIKGRALDYGAGRGFDAAQMKMEAYDPNFSPVMPPGLFDTITCIYVLNVIPYAHIVDGILADIERRLSPGGSAYVAVRRDVKQMGYTRRGTWQCNATICEVGWSLLYENKVFAIYHYAREM